ncbi:hypothetical protein C8R47DRAFT_1224139 [Mycena vitilis]|nr:hypothetical protein C8R47DRAFT_1224139 [Mycena vitilis]
MSTSSSSYYAARSKARLQGRRPLCHSYDTRQAGFGLPHFVPSTPSKKKSARAAPSTPSRKRGARLPSLQGVQPVSPSPHLSSKRRRIAPPLTDDEQAEKEVVDLLSPQLQHERDLTQDQVVQPPLAQWARLCQLDADIAGLLRERASLTSELASRTFSTLTLPVEVLGEIFGHVHDPTVLLAVCGHWNDVALSLPLLWSTFTLRFSLLTLPKKLPMARTLLMRSRRCPLFLTLRYGPDRLGSSIIGWEFYNLLLNTLGHSNHFLRLEYLDVGVSLISTSLELLRTPMPMLKHLCLWLDRIYTTELLAMLPQTFPRLHSIELRHVLMTPSVELPWQQITTLRCDDIQCRQFLEIIAQTPALVECEISRLHRGVDDHIGIPPLKHLQSLVFTQYEPEEDLRRTLFPVSTLTVPALRLLQIPETYLHSPSYDDLLKLVKRSQCRLEELRVIDLTYTSEQTFTQKLACNPWHK